MVHFTSLLAVVFASSSAVITVKAQEMSNLQIDPKITGPYWSFLYLWHSSVNGRNDPAAITACFSDSPIPTAVHNGVVYQGKEQIKLLFESGELSEGTTVKGDIKLNQKLLNSTLVSPSPLEITNHLIDEITNYATGEVKVANSVSTFKFNNDAYYGEMFSFIEDVTYVV